MNGTTLKLEIIVLLESTNRDGMDKLIDWLVANGFFKSPASSKYHGCYEGGLAVHSYDVFQKLNAYAGILKLDRVTGVGQNPLPITKNNLIVAGLLHDICKVGAYLPSKKEPGAYYWNKKQPKGHGELSIKRLKQFIVLDPIEELMIRYHMGLYGCNEFYGPDDWQTGEYPIRSDHSDCEGMTKEQSKAYRYGKSMANAWYHNPIVKVIYFCDELATLEEKANEDK